MPLVLAALASCSVPLSSVIGLSVEGDRVVATVLSCDGVTSDRIELVERGPQPFRLPRPSWDFSPANVAVVDLGDRDAFLALLDPDRRMGLDNRASWGAGGFVNFDLDDIASIDDGEVLSYDSTLGGTTKMDADGLRAQRDALCDIYD